MQENVILKLIISNPSQNNPLLLCIYIICFSCGHLTAPGTLVQMDRISKDLWFESQLRHLILATLCVTACPTIIDTLYMYCTNVSFTFQNAEAILKGMPSSVMRQNHSVEYRRYILGKLISHAHTHNDDVICDLPFCYKPSGDDINWIRCDECSRWFHIGCIGLLKPTDTFTCLYCIV